MAALWTACSQGDLDAVHAALGEQNIDLEINLSGTTPLIEAVKSGNAEMVKVLLDKGADPANASGQALAETFTTDQTILGMLNFARSKRASDLASTQENAYDSNEPQYAPPLPANYPYYPSINGAPPPEMFYPPPPPHMANGNPRQNNLPPPEVASAIPCRFYPACRYGASCLFQHPQGPPHGGYYGPVPPAGPYQGSYEQHAPQPYAQGYYPVSQPSFMNGQPPQHGPPMSMHVPPSAEMMPPPPPQAFSPTGAPTMPYGPISPIMYAHSGQAPLPMSIPPLGPTPQSPPAGFNPASPTAPPNGFPLQPNGHYQPVNGHVPAIYPDANGVVAKSPELNPQPDIAGARQDGFANRRGTGTARRGTFPRTKPTPPCMFFPLGRCKNGDDCRFPHIIPQDGIPPPAPFSLSRGGAPRPPRGHLNGNGYAAIDEKMAGLSLGQNGYTGSGFRGRGGRPPVNGHANKRAPFPTKQRVPNADEFPVLGGATTPPIRPNGSLVNGNGPTAAQVLQAPRPVRTSSSQAVTPRATTPERVQEPNGVVAEVPTIPSFASVATANVDVAVAA